MVLFWPPRWYDLIRVDRPRDWITSSMVRAWLDLYMIIHTSSAIAFACITRCMFMRNHSKLQFNKASRFDLECASYMKPLWRRFSCYARKSSRSIIKECKLQQSLSYNQIFKRAFIFIARFCIATCETCSQMYKSADNARLISRHFLYY